MPIDVDTVGSPGWWLAELQRKLNARQPDLEALYQRFTGDTPLPPSLRDAPETAKKFWKTARTNFAEMIVRAVLYRLSVTAIRTGVVGADDAGDAEAWRAWKDAGLEVAADDIARTFCWAGDAYGIVLRTDDDQLAATAEDPRQVVTIHDPVDQRIVLAAAKIYYDPIRARDCATLWLRGERGEPGRRFVAYKSRRATVDAGRRPKFARSWEWDEDEGGADGVELPDDLNEKRRLPVVRFRNEEGVGEFERHTDLLDRIDHLTLQAMTTATFQAFKQRAIQVDDSELETEDKDGNPVDLNELFKTSPDALWILPATAKIWESGEVNLQGVTTLTEKDLQRLSAVTFTPLSLFTPEAANQSANGADLVREGLVSKVEIRQKRLRQGFEQLLQLLFLAAGDRERAEAPIAVVMAPAAKYGLAERYDALSKSGVKMPWRIVAEDVMQMDGEQLRRAESLRMQEQFDAQLFGPPPAAPAAAAPAEQQQTEPAPA